MNRSQIKQMAIGKEYLRLRQEVGAQKMTAEELAQSLDRYSEGYTDAYIDLQQVGNAETAWRTDDTKEARQ